MQSKKANSLFQLALIVSALGFFVDVYDLILFAIIRKPSLSDLGLSPDRILSEGEFLISIQMLGMVIGGIAFGILGDKKGRMSVLFGSILLYSVANILNGMVSNAWQYAVLRFVAGFGLAGELGAGLTLVSEQLPKEKRSMAVAWVSGFGILGAVSAFFINKIFDWRTSYYLGGGLGLLLLVMRIRVHESGLYKEVKNAAVERGNFLMLFTSSERFLRYIKCILIGLPMWYIIGILVTFADQFGKEFGIKGIIPGKAIVLLYLGIAAGNLTVGWLSQQLKSRKKPLFIFYGITIVCCILFFLQRNGDATVFYILCFCLGYGAGFNVVYLTFGVEQFGTNLRASAAISIPNMVRGFLPIMILLFRYLRSVFNDYLTGAWVTGIILFAVAIGSAMSIKESFGKDLDFLEV
jgi:putative MFS transporter